MENHPSGGGIAEDVRILKRLDFWILPVSRVVRDLGYQVIWSLTQWSFNHLLAECSHV